VKWTIPHKRRVDHWPLSESGGECLQCEKARERDSQRNAKQAAASHALATKETTLSLTTLTLFAGSIAESVLSTLVEVAESGV